MGAAFSGSSLCRFVGGIEILVSSTIIIFGIKTLLKFYDMNEDFQEEYERIQYSAIAAVAQGILTIFAALVLLIGSRTQAKTPEMVDKEKDDPEASPSHIDARRAKSSGIVFKIWLAYSVLAIGVLLFVFISPMGYCIQNDNDKERQIKLREIGGENAMVISPDGRKQPLPPCYAESPDTVSLRTSLGDMYAYCVVNIFSLVSFMFLIYYQLKSFNRKEIRDKMEREACIEGNSATE